MNTENKPNQPELVHKFPYAELQNIAPSDITEICKCLPFLLDISRTDLFYTNLKAVKYTLEFVMSSLDGFQNVHAKEPFVHLLILLKEILLGVMKSDKLSNIFPNPNKIISLILYISDFDIFCTSCASICFSILEPVLTTTKYDFIAIDNDLVTIMEHFRIIGADKEFTKASEIVMEKIPFNTKVHKMCLFWLMDDSVRYLTNFQTESIKDGSHIINMLTNVRNFLYKGNKMICLESQFEEYATNFIEKLKSLSHVLIRLCCVDKTERAAKDLLQCVLFLFLEEQGITFYNLSDIIKNDINQFPLNVKDWTKHLCKTFFWICHLLYFYKRSIWSTGDICDALAHLMYNHNEKQKKIFSNIFVLKSICYIYPVVLYGPEKARKKQMISGDLLHAILPGFLPFLKRILSLSKNQLLWILVKGPVNVKIETVKFWFDQSKTFPENLQLLEEVLVATKSEKLVLEILKNIWTTTNTVDYKVIDLITKINSRVLYEKIPVLIPMFSTNLQAASALIKACCQEIPEDKNVALKAFKSLDFILALNPNDETLANIFNFAANLLTTLKTERDFIHSVYANQYWLKYPISRLYGNNEQLTKAILVFCTKLLKYQDSANYTSNPSIINLTSLLTQSPEVLEKTVGFLHELLKKRCIIELKETSILFLFSTLCGLTNSAQLQAKAFECLKGLLKLYPGLIDSPILGMLVEDRCHISNRKLQSPQSLKFILLWISLMHSRFNNNFCYLPEEGLLKMFFQRSIGLSEQIVRKFLAFISNIYSREKHCNDFQDSYEDINTVL